MRSFTEEVRSGDYPSEKYIVRTNNDVAEEYRKWLEKKYMIIFLSIVI